MPPFTGGALGPDIPGPAAPWVRYRNLRQGQPLLTPRGQALRPNLVPVRKGYVRFLATEGVAYSLDLLTTAEPYLLPDAFGAGWGTIERSGRKDRPKYDRDGLLRQAIPVILTTLKWPGLDIEDEWQALRHLARKGNGKRPPVIRLAGPVDHKDLDWTIVALDIDPDTTRRQGNRMVRQACVITVQEWPGGETADSLTTRAPARDRPRTVKTTTALDTVKKLAKHYHVRWQAIRDLNKGMGDPNRHLPVGTTVQIPPAAAATGTTFTGGAKAP